LQQQVIRFRDDTGEEHFGVFTDPVQQQARKVVRNSSGKLEVSGAALSIDTILPPVDPPAVWCVGLNYADHAEEVKKALPTYPILFSKTINSLTGHNSVVVMPAVARGEVDYEAELAVVIGKEARNVRAEHAMDFVLGYTIANDVTARRWQGGKGGGQWNRSKSFDNFLPLGPYLVPAKSVPDVQNLNIRTWVNGTLVQDSNTRNMVFSVAKLIEFISQGTTLYPGTVILTGTPAGVGYTKNLYLAPGDTVSISIDGLGMLFNSFAQEREDGMIDYVLPKMEHRQPPPQ
jgi:2-keto-4-pentenoate hydratase/2-oxohepta-3-ene-1,7-dioic acid hydratase in catechol pathway